MGRAYNEELKQLRFSNTRLIHVFERIDIDPVTGCWNWLGSVNNKGYGRIRYKYQEYLAHRFMYEFYNGKIPDGLFACHKCDNPRCCNPRHIFLGTQKSNMQDALKKGKLRIGSDSHFAKLTSEQVLAIRKDTTSIHRVIAAQYNISREHVSEIKNNKSWTWL